MDVMIAGGGTGGHLFPGIALAQELRRRDPNARILFVGTERGIERHAVPRAGFELATLPVSGLRGTGLSGWLSGLGRLPIAVAAALGMVRRFAPQVAVSVGGYAAGPAVVAARLLGVPLAVMEQNAVAGWTNRWIGRLARRIFAAMPCDDFPADKTVVVGNPVRADLLAVRHMPYAPQQPPRLLVLGGSQGARALNETLMAAAPLLQASGLPWQITHQTGKADVERVAAAYTQTGLAARATAFIDDMAAAYRDHDLLLCRAGATTLAELTVCGRPAILVPYPFAAGDHQTANARNLQGQHAALLLPQSTLTPRGLVQTLSEFCASPSRLMDMAAKSHACGKPQAVADIADALIEEFKHV